MNNEGFLQSLVNNKSACIVCGQELKAGRSGKEFCGKQCAASFQSMAGRVGRRTLKDAYKTYGPLAQVTFLNGV